MHVLAPAAAPARPSIHATLLARLLATGLVLAALLGTTAARADAYTEVRQLIQAGQLSEALRRTEQHLAGKPRDPQMRFLQGVVHSESGRQAEAEATFTRLVQDYPELPEPYNNLAVIQAAKGQWEQARQSLEMAVRLDPTYATAHENLGDIHAQLALRSYSQAQQLDRLRPQLPRKLSLVRELVTLTPPVRLSPANPK